MKNVFISMLILVAMAAVSHAEVLRGVAKDSKSSQFIKEAWTNTGADRTLLPNGELVNQHVDRIVDGSGFDEFRGFHTNDGIQTNGSMWLTDIEDTAPWVKFDLEADPNYPAGTLDKVKIWNFNEAPATHAYDRLGLGVQDMTITLYDSSDVQIGSVLGPFIIPIAPGLDNVDFGYVIDESTPTTGVSFTPTPDVRYVQFDLLSNYGDPQDQQYGLSEVRFYNTAPTVEPYAGRNQRAWLEDNSPDPNSVTIQLDGSLITEGVVGPVETHWAFYNAYKIPAYTNPYEPNELDPDYLNWTQTAPDPVFSDPNSLNPTVTLYATGEHFFVLDANDIGSDSSGFNTVNVNVYDVGYDGLVGHYAFDETSGTIASNSVSTPGLNTDIDDFDAAHNNWTTDAVLGGGALQFDGTKDAALVSDEDVDDAEDYYLYKINRLGDTEYPNYDLLFDSNAGGVMALSLWFKSDSPTEQFGKGLIAKGPWRISLVGDRAAIEVSAGNWTRNTSFPVWEAIGTTNVNDGQWHFAVMSYDGYSAKLYVDGRLDAQIDTYEGGIQLSGYPIFIGAVNNGGNPAFGWKGVLDEAKIYNIYLDQEQVYNAYLEGSPAPCVTYLAGDLSNDCEVNLEDFALLAQQWLQ